MDVGREAGHDDPAITFTDQPFQVRSGDRLAGREAWPIRIGLNSGPLIAGVVGEKKFAYDIWGDTVNLASRMESSGAPGRVNVTSAVLAQVERFVEYESRGKVNLKGKGDVECWFVDRLRPEFSSDERGRTANAMLMELRSAQQKA